MKISKETTLVLIKPDAVQRGLVGDTVLRLEKTGLKIVGMKMLRVSEKLASKHYSEHASKPFYPGLVEFITSSPIVALALQGREAIKRVRNLVGSTDPLNAQPGTIRGDFGLDTGRNLIHASANSDDAAREVRLFFEESEVLDYSRSYDGWVEENA